MTPEERKAQKALDLLKLLDQDFVSTEEYKASLDILASIVQGAVEVNEKQKDDFVKYCTAQMETMQGDCRNALHAALEHVSKLKDGKDGRDGEDGVDGLDGKDGAPGRDGKDGSPDTGGDIIKKINEAEEKIAADRVEMDKFSAGMADSILNRAIGIVDQRSSFLINKAEQLRVDVNTKVTGWGTHNITVSDTAPSNPSLNDLWVDTT